MIDFPGQQILAFFSLLALGDIDRNSADAHYTAALIEGCRGRPNAPANPAVRPNDAEFSFV